VDQIHVFITLSVFQKGLPMMKTMHFANELRSKKYIFLFFFILLVFAVLLIYNNLISFRPFSASAKATVITQNTLEEKYGLRVNLLAVTAAGGMVDLRLKIVDGDKARLLLQDKKNFPALLVSDNNLMLITDADTQSQEIKFDPNGDLFLMFPNSGNAVKPGSAVMVVFGGINLEPISAR
jgi:hypothetical protein